MNLGVSVILVYGGLLLVGTIFALLFTTISCSKRSVGTSFKEGAIWSLGPTTMYALASYVERVRLPFAHVLISMGASPERSEMLATGYLMMLASWVMTTFTFHSVELEVCQPTVDEMAAFKKELLKKLDEDEKKKSTS